MNIIVKDAPSEQAELALQALKTAVHNTLEKKRKLGQYAIVWDGSKVVTLNGQTQQITEVPPLTVK
ncbi:hypothetical protein QE250_07070 [Chromatiaceae bacterium AAb-1]|nr:hypothetical protein [Chromatiaceae bacterium AAb-1]